MNRYSFVTSGNDVIMTHKHMTPTLQFVSPGPVLDRLIDGVRRGVKTATSALELSFTMRGESLPRVGDRYTLIDSDNSPAAEIELTDVRVLRLDEVDLDVATAEGDWFDSVEQWREAHERFFNRSAERVATFLELDSWQASDDTMVVVRFFRVVWCS